MQQVYTVEFGPQEAEKVLNTEMTKEEKDIHIKEAKRQREQIKKGYGRIQEKVKEIRQNFSSAMVNGRRSGSGKVVFQHYDRLVKIYGGTASSEPINTGVDTDTFNCLNESGESEFIVENEILGDDLSVDLSDCATASTSDTNKRKAEDACVKLIDNKRKHMERNLSAAQRDQILLKESRDEMNFKKEMTEVMKESSRNTSNAITQMTTAIENIGTGLARSIEMLATVFSHQQQQQNQQWAPQPAQFHNFNFPQPMPKNVNAYVPDEHRK